MKNAPHTLAALAIVIGTLTHSPVSKAGIPTTDGIVYSQLLVQGQTMIKQFAALIDQLNTLRSQLDLSKEQFEEMRGLTTIGNEISAQLDSHRDNLFALKAPSDVFKELTYTAEKLFEKESKARESFIKRSTYVQSNVEQVNTMYEGLLERKSALNALKAQISNATTNKQILDLTARIAAENGLLQNDIALINMFKISMDVGTQALRLEEDSRRIANLKGVDDVGQ